MNWRHRAVIGLAALAVLVVSIVVGSSLVSSPAKQQPRRATTQAAAATSPAPSSPAPAVPAGFVLDDDMQAAFSIAYPQAWKRLPVTDPQVRLLVADGSKVSLLIRVSPVGLPITRRTLSSARALTDSLVGAARDVKLLAQPSEITLDGLPGYRYLYTYAAGTKPGERGAHAHYFVFRNGRLITLVFQVPNVGDLKRASALLEQITGTFHKTFRETQAP